MPSARSVGRRGEVLRLLNVPPFCRWHRRHWPSHHHRPANLSSLTCCSFSHSCSISRQVTRCILVLCTSLIGTDQAASTHSHLHLRWCGQLLSLQFGQNIFNLRQHRLIATLYRFKSDAATASPSLQCHSRCHDRSK